MILGRICATMFPPLPRPSSVNPAVSICRLPDGFTMFMVSACPRDFLTFLAFDPCWGAAHCRRNSSGGPRTVVLSYSLWKNTFDGDRNIIGRLFASRVFLILPSEYCLPGLRLLRRRTSGPRFALTRRKRGRDNYQPILRLNPGASWQQVDAQLSQLQSLTSRVLEKRYPGARFSYYAVPLQQSLAADSRTPAMILMSAVGFVLLVACANLAGLALVRVGRRESEIATRLALGATKWAILRQFWMESLLLSIASVLSALLVGSLTLQLMNRRLPEEFLPLGGVSMDVRVLLFTAAAGIAASLFFGLLPALNTRRIDVRAALAMGSTRSIAHSGSTPHTICADFRLRWH